MLGIRGTVNGPNTKNLTPIDVVQYTSAYGTWINKKNQNKDKTIVLENEERGIFVTYDGGKNWNKSLFVNNNTGAIDLISDPKDFNIPIPGYEDLDELLSPVPT